MHFHLKKEDIANVTTKVFSILPDPEMAPWQAYQELVRGNVEELGIREMTGRIPAVMLVPYPPGIPVIMPGEKFNDRSKAILDYLAIFEDFDNSFPGFETETHGVTPRRVDGRIRYFVNCLK